MSFSNKAVLITGGSSGIGAAAAVLFTEEGADVAIVGRNETKLNNVAEECAKVGKKPLIIRADVSKDEEANTIIKTTVDSFGKLDVLVNNAGILTTVGLTEDSFMNSYDEAMNTNMRPVVLITTPAIPYLIKTKGNIINISSIASFNVSRPGFLSYRVSKAALNHFTLGAAAELAPFGVRVNAVSPGAVKTDIFEKVGMTNVDDLKEFTALDRVLECKEIADMILYLSSEKARGITGSNYVIDNGELLKQP